MNALCEILTYPCRRSSKRRVHLCLPDLDRIHYQNLGISKALLQRTVGNNTGVFQFFGVLSSSGRCIVVIMPGRKRTLEDPSSSHKSKKTKVSLKKSNKSSGGHDVPVHSILEQEKIDFPRGGGTTLTPQEVKEIRAEGVKEADKELFFVSSLDYTL